MRVPTWLFITGLAAFLVITLVCAAAALFGARQLSRDASLAGIRVAPLADSLRSTATPVTIPTLVAPQVATRVAPLQATAAPLPPTVPPPLSDPRARNILLLGVDQRSGSGDVERGYRTDTMMVVRIDPSRERLALLSIPRDLWLEFSDGGPPARINTANIRGDNQGYPGGGGGLLTDTLQSNFGLRIDNFLLINFDAFLDTVDLLAPDGVEICIDERIDDHKFPDNGRGTMTVTFLAGCHPYDAERLLQFARTRATPGADFDRARRQQQVLGALLRHLVSLEGIGHLLASAPLLWQELANSFRTDLSIDEILQFALLLRSIPPDSLRTEVIDNRVVRFGTTPEGDQVLYPDSAAIRALIQGTFGNGA